MSDGIEVNPGDAAGRVTVATDVVDNVHIPVYKPSFGKDGEATLVSEVNPLPTANTESQLHSFARQEELLEEAVLQLRLLNKYMSAGQDEEFDETDLEEY